MYLYSHSTHQPFRRSDNRPVAGRIEGGARHDAHPPAVIHERPTRIPVPSTEQMDVKDEKRREGEGREDLRKDMERGMEGRMRGKIGRDEWERRTMAG